MSFLKALGRFSTFLSGAAFALGAVGLEIISNLAVATAVVGGLLVVSWLAALLWPECDALATE